MMDLNQPPGPSILDWSYANLHVKKCEPHDGSEPIFELRKELVVNGVLNVQYIWLTRLQLRNIGIDFGL
jgi:hypothetical protein